MRPIKNCFACVAITALAFLVSCSGGDQTQGAAQANDSSAKDSSAINTQATNGTTGITAIPADRLIIPGEKIGKLYLGQIDKAVFEILGRPVGGDAAMGKAWSLWKDFAVFTSYKDTSMLAKDVKQIKVSSSAYQTNNGIKVGSSLKEIQQAFQINNKPTTYINKAKTDSLFVYDSEKEGIAFEVRNTNNQKTCTGISVHPKNKSVNSTYLTIYPDWQLVRK